MKKSLVVGVDGSVTAGYALAWAIREAQLRSTGLRIVNAGEPWPGPHEWSDEVLAKAQAQAQRAAPDLEVTAERHDGRAVDALVSLAPDATMIVVGRRGIGGFTGLLLGSVAHGVSRRASCPVVTVPAPELPTSNHVVVGVDASEPSQAAIGFAFEEAELRGAELRAVFTWTQPLVDPGDIPPVFYDYDAVHEEARRLLAEALAGWGDEHPDVKVDAQVVRGHPVRVLADRSSTAQLLVVSHSTSSNRLRAALGSTTHGVLHHASCPVAVVP